MRPRNHERINFHDRDSSLFDSPNHHCGCIGPTSQGPVEATGHNSHRAYEDDDKSEMNMKEQGMVVGDEEMALGTVGVKEVMPGGIIE